MCEGREGRGNGWWVICWRRRKGGRGRKKEGRGKGGRGRKKKAWRRSKWKGVVVSEYWREKKSVTKWRKEVAGGR